jgi:rod shape-determining protein MreD
MIWFPILLLQALASALETSLGGPWIRGHVWCDLTGGLVVYLALFRGRRTGAIAGFTGGLLADLAGPGLLGRSSLVLAWAGYLVGRAGERMPRENSLIQYLLIVATVLARQLVSLALASSPFTAGGPAAVLLYALPTALASGLAGLGLFRVTGKLGVFRVR